MSADKHPAEVLARFVELADWTKPAEMLISSDAARKHIADMLRRIPALESEKSFLLSVLKDHLAHSDDLEAERDQLRAEVESLRADAERWRILRAHHEGDEALAFTVFGPGIDSLLDPVGSLPGELDAAIDAARKAGP